MYKFTMEKKKKDIYTVTTSKKNILPMDLILVRDIKKGTLKLIPFPKNDPTIWDKIKKKKLKGGLK